MLALCDLTHLTLLFAKFVGERCTQVQQTLCEGRHTEQNPTLLYVDPIKLYRNTKICL